MLDLISAYENYLTKVKQASNNTITSYMRDIRQFAGWLSTTEELDTVDATQENISRYMEVLEEEGRSTATQARCVASLRNFYSYLVSSGFLEQSPVTDVKVERKERKLPQILTNREIELLLSQPVCIDDKGFRDKAMLEVLYATGMAGVGTHRPERFGRESGPGHREMHHLPQDPFHPPVSRRPEGPAGLHGRASGFPADGFRRACSVRQRQRDPHQPPGLLENPQALSGDGPY